MIKITLPDGTVLEKPLGVTGLEIADLTGIDASYKDELLTIEGNLREKYKGTIEFKKKPYLNE